MDLEGISSSNLDSAQKSFLWRRQEEILSTLVQFGMPADLPEAEVFEIFCSRDRSRCGLRTKVGTMYPLYLNVKLRESNHLPALEIAELYTYTVPQVLKEYRYAIAWQSTKEFVSYDEYVPEFVATLKRCIRFDYKDPPHQGEPLHHWHPNGVSEFRLECCEMTPGSVLLFGLRAFDPPRFAALERTYGNRAAISTVERFFSAMENLRLPQA